MPTASVVIGPAGGVSANSAAAAAMLASCCVPPSSGYGTPSVMKTTTFRPPGESVAGGVNASIAEY